MLKERDISVPLVEPGRGSFRNVIISTVKWYFSPLWGRRQKIQKWTWSKQENRNSKKWCLLILLPFDSASRPFAQRTNLLTQICVLCSFLKWTSKWFQIFSWQRNCKGMSIHFLNGSLLWWPRRCWSGKMWKEHLIESTLSAQFSIIQTNPLSPPADTQ